MIGLCFTGESVLAISAGIKRQTRRLHKRPRFKVGDRSYVKESIVCTSVYKAGDEVRAAAVYAADDSRVWLDSWPWPRLKLSSMFMPAALRRYDLTIIQVREQRLQEISEEDAIAEGVKVIPFNPEGDCWTTGRAVSAFEYAWNELHGWSPNAWAANPVVVAYTFEAELRPELR